MGAKDVVRFLTPGVAISVTGGLTSALCGGFSKSRGTSPLQPPSWVFGVVWPLLYVTTGVAWALSKKDALLGSVVALCCLWLPLHLCGNHTKWLDFTVLSASAAVAWVTVVRLEGPQRWCMLPLALWLTFASVLNATSEKLKR